MNRHRATETQRRKERAQLFLSISPSLFLHIFLCGSVALWLCGSVA
jgi:hypothetical protein